MRCGLSILTVSCLALASCQHTPDVIKLCTPIQDYPAQFQHQLSAELGQLKSDSAIVRAITDYEALRDAERACFDAKASGGWGVGVFQ